MRALFEVAWEEIGGAGRVVSKRRAFITPEARDSFIDKLVEKDSFYRVIGYLDC